jgi:hypothetical protein
MSGYNLEVISTTANVQTARIHFLYNQRRAGTTRSVNIVCFGPIARQWPTVVLSRVNEFPKGRYVRRPHEPFSLVSTIAFVSIMC